MARQVPRQPEQRTRARQAGTSTGRARSQTTPSDGTGVDGLATLHAAIGNRAVAGLLREPAIARHEAAPTVTFITRDIDPGSGQEQFNPHSVVNDLRRAIDQAHKTVKGTKKPDGNNPFSGIEFEYHRKIDFTKVYAALDNLSGDRVAEVRRLYKEAESTTLDNDLFEGGQSQTPTSLTAVERSRLQVLLRGTTGTAVGTEVPAVLRFRPDLAALISGSKLAPDVLNRLQRTALDLVDMIPGGNLKGPVLEQVMAIHRRPVAEIGVIDAFFFGASMYDLPGMLYAKLEDPIQRQRLFALREGDRVLADAHDIESKRRGIEMIDAVREENSTLFDLQSAASFLGSGVDQSKRLAAQREGMVRDIDAVIARNRKEALDEAKGTTTSASQAVADRVQAVLGKGKDEQGRNIGDLLKQTLGDTKAAEITAILNAELIQAHASRLAELESRRATKPEHIVETLKALRDEAKHDVVAQVADPWLSDTERKQQLDPAVFEPRVQQRASAYVSQVQHAYESSRGQGREWNDIVAGFKSADEDEVNRLTKGAGELKDEEEIDLAIRRDKLDLALAVLRRQGSREDVDNLTGRYWLLTQRSLRADLLGWSNLTGGAALVDEAILPKAVVPLVSGGIAQGREAALVGEQLEKPSKAAMASGGDAAMQWVVASAEKEFRATWGNRGLTGRAREWGDTPETQQIMQESITKVRALQIQWFATQDRTRHREILKEMKLWRATLSGDLKAYQEDNKKVLDAFRDALSIVVALALAVALPGAGAGLMGLIQATAIQIAATVASNVLIYQDDYSLSRLRDDVFGGALGAAGGKFGEKLASLAAKEAKVVIAALADRIAPAIAKETGAIAAKAGLGTKIFLEAGSQAGSLAADSVYSGENKFTLENITQANLINFGAKLGKKVFGLEPKPTSRPDEPGAKRPDEDASHGKPVPDEPSLAKPDADGTSPKRPQDATTVAPIHPGSVVTGGGGAGGGKRPPGGPIDPASAGIPPTSQRSIQQLADQRNVIIKARPVNLDSIPHLERGALAKPEIVKSKTLKPIDELIGGPKGKEGLVGFFEPHPPSETLPADVRKAAMERYEQRRADYEQHLAEYQKLETEGILRRNNGVLELVDLRPGAEKGSFKAVSGDLDIYDIVHADGTALTADQRTAIINELRFMGVNVEHGAHEWWRQQSPETFDPKIDADVRAQHSTQDPLVAFVPLSPPQGVWADTSVTGPARTEGPGDRHMPLKGASEAPPGGPFPPGGDGSAVKPKDATLAPAPGSGPSQPAPQGGPAPTTSTGFHDPVAASRALADASIAGERLRMINDPAEALRSWRESGHPNDTVAPAAWHDATGTLVVDATRVRAVVRSNDILAGPLREIGPVQGAGPPHGETLDSIRPSSIPDTGDVAGKRAGPRDGGGESQPPLVLEPIFDTALAAQAFHDRMQMHQADQIVTPPGATFAPDLYQANWALAGGQGAAPPAWLDQYGRLNVDATRVDVHTPPVESGVPVEVH